MSDKTRSTKLTRREFLRGAAVVGGGAVLAACAPAATPAPSPTPVPEGAKPTPVEEAYGGPLSVEKGTIELQIREPGTQRAGAFEKMKEALLEMYPETQWNLVYDMQNWDVLRPRFIAGDPPDGCWLSVSGDPWGLLDEGLLIDLTPLMEAPAYGQEDKKFKDIFLPGLLEPGQKDGRQYLIPHAVSAWGLWYSHTLAEEHGWAKAIPADFPWKWDDFKALLKDVKAAGISPVLSGGPGNAGSFWWAFWLNFVYQVGGDAQINAMDSLTAGAWNNEVILTALARVKELFDEELIDPLWSSIDWTDADTLLFQKKAFFKPDGSWYVGSNVDKIPEGFNLGYAPIPTIPEVVGSPKLIQASAEPSWMVPLGAKHPRGGMEWIRLWDSKPFSVVFAEIAGDLLPIYGSGEGANWHPAAAELLKYFGQAERYYNPMYMTWYARLRDGTTDPFFRLATGELTPKECADAFEALAEETRKDPAITKHKRG